MSAPSPGLRPSAESRSARDSRSAKKWRPALRFSFRKLVVRTGRRRFESKSSAQALSRPRIPSLRIIAAAVPFVMPHLL